MLNQIENRMVRDSVWESAEKKLTGPGYFNQRTGVFIAEADAFEYMIEICAGDPDKADEVMECFYADWIKED